MKKMFKNRDLFSPHLIKIPTPYFAVFYNGTRNRPEREVVRLSESFEKPTSDPQIELECTIYNINPGKDEELLNKCHVLNEYTSFVEIARKHDEEGIDNPIEETIEECIRKHILEKFLKERRAEVLKAMTIDMTFERREVLIREEEREYGRKEGMEEGTRIVLDELIGDGSITPEQAKEIRQRVSDRSNL